MIYTQLGTTGLTVSRFCLGTMTFGSNDDAGMWQQMGGLGQREADQLVNQALEAGINFFDTADVYAYGGSEKQLGRALIDNGVNRADVVIATKCGVPFQNLPNRRGASRIHIMDSVKGSLERLQLSHIDLYQIHANDPSTPLEETLEALEDLKREGLIHYSGVSNWRAARIARAQGISHAQRQMGFASLQAYYSLAGRDIERELVPMLTEEQLGLLVWSPLAGGLLSGKFDLDNTSQGAGRRQSFDFPPVDHDRARRCLKAMHPIAQAHEVSVAAIALAWLLHQPHVSSVLLGARQPHQLAENLKAMEITLSAEELTALDEASRLPVEYPEWMITNQSTEQR